ncbi:transglycosylase domain-containing protein [Chloroflexi bacterium TSY]|nr:transglycosylase domain-containing protein [Chloroflexi bacterium TSY]
MPDSRPLGVLVLLLLSSAVALLVGCGATDNLADIRPRPHALIERTTARLAKQLTTSEILGPRTEADPLTAVEFYMQEYQPGPLPRVFQTTYLYDRNGMLIAELFPNGRRTWVGLASVAQSLIDATIATEDATFYSNTGVDPRRLAGALLQNAKAEGIVSGGSTISMQLARNIFMGTEERFDLSLNRKMLEIGLAQELTMLYSKDELLEMYLNLLNYGNLAYGPEAAAQVYFGKSAVDLNLAEATLLAGIPQRPAELNPFTNFDEVKDRQRIVLDLMVRHGYLTARQADLIFSQPLQLRSDVSLTPINHAPHFTQYVFDTLGETFGDEYIARSGIRIVTSLDLGMQELAQRTVTEEVAKLRGSNISTAALVALKPGTAEILAMVGSANFFDEAIAGQVNVATRLRQPGSTVKPILYAAALDANLISPATILWDTPMYYDVKGQPRYRPRNYDNKFHGPVTVRTALANSYNIPAVKLLDAFGVDKMVDIARKMVLKSLRDERNWYGLSVTLGGGEVTLIDLSAAFHTLANGGRYLSPQPILAIVGRGGQTQMPVSFRDELPVVSPRAAFLVTDILNDQQARAPMFGINSLLNLSRPAAAKTGTTTDWRDNWTVGYTRYLVTGVWAGNADGKPTRQSTGVRGAGPIWRNFMEAVIADPAMLAVLDAPAEPEAWQFPQPDGIEVRAQCPPNLSCRDEGEYFTHDWLKAVGIGSPLRDSVVYAEAAPVYLSRDGQSRRLGYCRVPNSSASQARTPLLKLPAELGPSSPHHLTKQASVDLESDGALKETPIEDAAQERAKRIEPDRALALNWSLNGSWPVLLGTCDSLDQNVRRYLPTNLRNGSLLVDYSNVERPAVASRSPRNTEETKQEETEQEEAVPEKSAQEESAQNETVEAEPTETPPPPEPAIPASSSVRTAYVTQSVEHGNNCPGNYIMGRIINSEGGPVPGVRVRAIDEWGNQSDAVSKGGAGEVGLFDIPLYTDRPRDIYVNVLDGAGNPISAATLVPHRKGSVETGCHMVVFRRVN